jgi:hypothetical protein
MFIVFSGWLMSHLGIFLNQFAHIFIWRHTLEAKLYQAEKQVGANFAMEHRPERDLAVVAIDSRLDVAGNASPAYKLDGGISRLDEGMAGGTAHRPAPVKGMVIVWRFVGPGAIIVWVEVA